MLKTIECNRTEWNTYEGLLTNVFSNKYVGLPFNIPNLAVVFCSTIDFIHRDTLVHINTSNSYQTS